LQRYLCYTAAQAYIYAILKTLAEVPVLYCCTGIYVCHMRCCCKVSLLYCCTGIYVCHMRGCCRGICYTVAYGIYVCHTRGCCRGISVILLHRHLRVPYEMLLQRYLCYTAAQTSTYAISEAVA
jgi:hypothetical protein